jgi:hypothetical protein
MTKIVFDHIGGTNGRAFQKTFQMGIIFCEKIFYTDLGAVQGIIAYFGKI